MLVQKRIWQIIMLLTLQTFALNDTFLLLPPAPVSACDVLTFFKEMA